MDGSLEGRELNWLDEAEFLIAPLFQTWISVTFKSLYRPNV